LHSKEAEKYMFIFANLFELALTLPQLTVAEVYPMLQTLKVLVKYLPKILFDTERSFVDEYYLTLILRNQLFKLFEYQTTARVFAIVFGELRDRKHSIFDQTFNP